MLGISFQYQEFWIVPVIALSGLVLGWCIDKLVLRRLLEVFGTRGWQGESFIRKAFSGFFTFGFFIAGIYAAVHYKVDDEVLSAKINLWAKVLYISFLAIYISRGLGALVHYYTEQQGTHIPNSSILVNLVRFIIIIIGFVVILNSVGISITPILTALGVGGLAVALALQDTLGNLFAGLQILAARKITMGNYIRLESGDEGQIEDIAWRNTTIRTPRNNRVVIPNTRIANSILTNFSAPTEDFLIAIDGTIPFKSDLDRVYSVLLEEANALMSEGVPTPERVGPSVVFTAFLESGVSFRVMLRVRNFNEQVQLRHSMIRRIHARFNKEGIEMLHLIKDQNRSVTF